MKIVGVVEEEPFDYRTWSGSSAYFFEQLRSRDVLSTAFSTQPGKLLERSFQLKNFHLDLDKWRFKYHIDPALARMRTRIAESRASGLSDDFDAYLQIGAWHDLTGLGKPVVSYHDGNLARRLDSPYGYPAIRQKYLNRALQWEQQVYSRLDVIFTMSKWLADSFVADFGVDEAKVCPIYAGINMPDVDEFSPASYSSRNILFVGKQFERKGGDVLLEAFQLVRRELRDATLTIVGPTLPHLPAGVVNPGYVSKSTPAGLAKLKGLYREAAVFALPTLYEPFGISFVEAMAHGLPCVGTNLCAIPEIITDDVTGYLVPPHQPQALADRLISLLRNPSICAKFGRSGFERYRQHFTWQAVTDKLVLRLEQTF